MTRLLIICLIVYSAAISAYAISVTVLYHQMWRMDRTIEVARGLDSLRQEMDKRDKLTGPERAWYELLPEEEE